MSTLGHCRCYRYIQAELAHQGYGRLYFPASYFGEGSTLELATLVVMIDAGGG
jgi:hypothetical protein